MNSNPSEGSPILRSAWQLHADYNMNADMSVRRHWRLREWVIIISVIATLLAILSDIYRTTPFFGELIGQVLRIFLVIVPITGSVVLALANKFQEGERWLALRNGAEDILRVIYLYRTVLSTNPNRDQWLEERLAEIRKEALQKVKGNLALKAHKDAIPALRGSIDKGFDNLQVDNYIEYRLNFQIKQYAQKITDVQKIRTRLQITIFALGGVGSLLAALSNIGGLGGFSIWVAFSTALAAALGSWLELRQLDWRVLRGMSSEDRQKLYILNTEKASSQSAMDDPLESTVAIYSHIINELSIAHDHWISLNSENQTVNEFNELVLIVERVLWGKDFSLGEHAQVSEVEENRDAKQDARSGMEVAGTAGSKEIQSNFTLDTKTRIGTTRLRPEVGPHALVLMPHGRKLSREGLRIDFDNVFSALIEPALSKAGFSVYRWIESAGDDAFQELLLADLVVADIGVDDADVFYNMGIRHAFRKRGVIHIREAQSLNSFGTFYLRTMTYHCNKYGRVDSSMQKDDEIVLGNLARDVWVSQENRIHSPVYALLEGLTEPDRRTLRTPKATVFWREYNEWKKRVTIAQRQKRIGDILLLTEEIQNPLIKEEAIAEAGRALANMGQNELALREYRNGLEINSRNLTFRREEAFHLNRLGRVDEAIVKIESILADYPNDVEAISYLGRIYKEMWVDSWKWVENLEKRLHTAFDSYHWLIKAIDTYMKSYRIDLNQFYPGVNALTLSIMLVDLANRYDNPKSRAPEIVRVNNDIEELRGCLAFALESQIDEERADYFPLISMAELKVLTAEKTDEVVDIYRKAVTGSRRNTFFLQSSLAQLEMFTALEIRPEFVETAIQIVHDELNRIRKEAAVVDNDEVGRKAISTPKYGSERHAFLFTGYMINSIHKQDGHFPPEKEQDVKYVIGGVLDKYNAGEDDLAITAGMAAGSEILFIEVCVERGISVQVYFPSREADYVRDFVSPGGEQWVERFYKLRNHPLIDEFYQPDEVGLPKENDNIYERNNRWALYSSLVRGIDNVSLIAFWDGKTDTSTDLDAYLVKHMIDLMRDTGGIIELINPYKISFNSTTDNDLPEYQAEGTMTKKKRASKRKP